MRPFVCVHCDAGWLGSGSTSACEYCGRPGFTIYFDTQREFRNLDPLTCDILLRAARRQGN